MYSYIHTETKNTYVHIYIYIHELPGGRIAASEVGSGPPPSEPTFPGQAYPSIVCHPSERLGGGDSGSKAQG